jgi:hypothetical protein
MASNDMPKTDEGSKLVRCDNCRQNILETKMFLHEGFCFRNNVFCDHCQKVFLKKDYQDHLNNSQNKKNRNSTKSKKSMKKQKMHIFRSPIITKRKTAFEYIEMPMIEELKINNPIIISDGKIVSNKNKNDYLLPLFGIKSLEKNNNNNFMNSQDFYNNNVDLNQTGVLNDIDSIKKGFDEFNIGINLEKKMKNSLSMGDLLMSHNLLTENMLNSPIREQRNYEKDNFIKIEDNNNNYNNINNAEFPYKENSISNLLKYKTVDDSNLNDNYINNIDINNNNNYTNSIDINNNNNYEERNKDKQDKNIIINNNIITYNSTNSINKINNFYNKEEKEYVNNKSPNLDLIKRNKLINRQKDMCNIKEPNDSKSKNTFQNYKFSSYIMEKEKKPKNNHSKKNELKQKSKLVENKNNKKEKEKCEFCNSEVDDLVVHYQYYHFKRVNDFIIPKKRDTVLLNEKLSEENTDEVCIDENKKKILMREIKPNLHAHPNIVSDRLTLAAPYRIKLENFQKPEKIEKITKKINNDNSKNIRNKFKNIKKNFWTINYKQSNSEDDIKYEEKNMASKSNINTYNSPEIKTDMINSCYDNDNFYDYNPLMLYTEQRDNNYYIDTINNCPNNNYIY